MAEQIRHVVDLAKGLRISKKRAGYFEIRDFKENTDLDHGYFCYSCVYFLNTQGGRCAIVLNKGEDCLGSISEVIAPHGYCALWAPNRAITEKTR